MQHKAVAQVHTSGQTDGLKGIGLMCLALAVFSCLDTTAKYMATSAELPVTQVVWVRFLSQFIFIVLVTGLLALPRLMTTRKLGFQLTRSALMLVSTVLNFMALRHLQLDQTQTVSFLAPFIVALLGGPCLGEWVGWRRMMAILVGFCGILVVVRPGFVEFEPALMLALGGVLCYAIFILITRYLTTYDAPEVTLFYSLVAGTVLMAPFAIVEWVWPTSAKIWALLLSMGVWGGIGHYIFILAYRHAPAAILAPFIYLGLITHALGGWLVFGQVPDRWTLAGAAIVIASGVYLIHRERVRTSERQAR
jgi:drug/metabolite transporter (DMT)-like permease